MSWPGDRNREILPPRQRFQRRSHTTSSGAGPLSLSNRRRQRSSRWFDCRSWANSCSQRQGEAEYGAKGRSGFRPQAALMSFNDRVTDCQPHSHALGLRGEEAFEDAVPVCWVKTNTGIRHVDGDVALIVELRADRQDTWAVSDRTHRVDPVHDQVENDLLQLDPVSHDGRKL